MKTNSHEKWMRVTSILVVVSIFCNLLFPVLTASAEVVDTIQDNSNQPSIGAEPETEVEFGSGWSTHSFEPPVQAPILADLIESQFEPIVESIGLQISLNPAIIIEGKPVTLSWELRGWNQIKDKADREIKVFLPTDLAPTDLATAKEASETGYLSIYPLSPTGSLDLSVEPDPELPLAIRVSLFIDGISLDEEVAILDSSRQKVTAAGGDVQGLDGKVQISIPKNAAVQELSFDIRNPSPNKMPVVSLSGQPIEIIAAGTATGKNITQFDQPIRVQVSYQEDQIWGWDERDLKLFYFDEETAQWWPIETTVDAENNTLTAEVDHLTVFDYKAESWQSATVPTVDSFQVSSFTGSGTYQLSFWIPPAPGAFQPEVVLSYNSQWVDNSTANTQASWVGAGWSLNTSSINRNMHGTNSDTSDDTYILNVAGVSSTLFKVSTNGNLERYKTADENFMVIERDTSDETWTVWAKDGTRYDFESKAVNNATMACVTNSNDLNFVWGNYLTRITDVHGAHIDFTYRMETKTSCLNTIAVYPDTIDYPNQKYRIKFIPEDRLDYQESWGATSSTVLFGKDRLKEIRVQHYTGSAWENIRKYKFSYSTGTTNQIYPNFILPNNAGGGRTLTLAGVQEYNGDESDHLPATSFYYEDDMHLTKVENGYGGSVEMTYGKWQYEDELNTDEYEFKTLYGQQGYDCYNGSGLTWTVVEPTVECKAVSPYPLRLYNGSPAIAQHTIPEHLLKIGGTYYFMVSAQKAGLYGEEIWWGMTDGTHTDVEEYSDALNGTYTDLEFTFDLPTTFEFNTKLQIKCYNCAIDETALRYRPVTYRVLERVITDAVSVDTSTYTYRYDNPAPNDANTSAAVASSSANPPYSDLYTPPNSQFRGHAMTSIKAPNGLTSITYFHQDDLFKGSQYKALIVAEDYSLNSFETSSDLTGWSTTGNVGIELVGYDNAVTAVNGNQDWSVGLTNTYSVEDGEASLSHVRLQGASAQLQVGLDDGSGKFFGVILNNSNQSARIRYNNGAGDVDGSYLIGTGSLDLDKWYAVLIIKDHDDGFLARIWQLADPSNSGEDSVSMSASSNWRYSHKVWNGTGDLDSYLEGFIYSESDQTYGHTTYHNNMLGYLDNDVAWTYTTSQSSRTYEQDATYTATKSEYLYSTSSQGGEQYGNLTHTTESYWDESQSTWVAHRASMTVYLPNNFDFYGKYIVSLPRSNRVIDCAGGCDYSGQTGLMSEQLYLYDENYLYWWPPEFGEVTDIITRVVGTPPQRPLYSWMSYDYDSWGNTTSVTTYTGFGIGGGDWQAPNGAQTTTTTYDSTYHTYPITVTNPLTQSVTSTYDYELGVPTSITDQNSNTTYAEYDDFGRMTKIIAPGDTSGLPTLKIEYNNFASASSPFNVRLTQKLNGTQSMILAHFYSGTGQLLQTQTANVAIAGETNLKNVVVDYDYDQLGRLVQQTVPYAVAADSTPDFSTQYFTQPLTATTYDILGRVTSSEAPNGNEVTTTYDDLTVSQTDPETNTTITNFDVWGNVIEVDPPFGPSLAYEYDVLGRLIEVQKGALDPIQISYDYASNKISMSDPDMGDWTYEYNGVGNLTEQTDARGCVIALSYDSLNRLTGKTYSGPGACDSTPDVTYSYDYGTNGVGYRTGMTDGSGSTAWEYDERGRLIKETKTITGATSSFVTEWSYNSADMPVTMTMPDGTNPEVLNYTYNDQGALTELKNNDTEPLKYAQNIQYDVAGRLKSIDLSNILRKTFNYNAWTTSEDGGLLNQATTDQLTGAEDTLQNFVYDYDANSNIVSIENNVAGETSTFTYDAINQILSMTVTDDQTRSTIFSEAFNYNSSTGNLWHKGASTQDWEEYYYNATQPHAVSSIGTATQMYSYDANGSMIERDVDGGTQYLTYDAENRVIEVESPRLAFTPREDKIYVWNGLDSQKISLSAAEISDVGAKQINSTGVLEEITDSFVSLVTWSVGHIDDLVQDLVPSPTPQSPPPSTEAEPTHTATPEATSAPSPTPTPEPTATPSDSSDASQTLVDSNALIVNSTGDSGDAKPGDGLCDDGTGTCTLRAAIEEANASAGEDVIGFDLPDKGIQPIQVESEFPAISETITIDGTTQPGYTGTPVVMIDGSKAGEWTNGLVVQADGCTLRGLAIVNFDRAGIHLLGGKNVIENNFIGMDPDGTTAGENRIGILVEGGKNNTIGGSVDTGNLISGNRVGVYLYGSGTASNKIAGNLIGTALVGNQVGVRINGAPGNLIGGKGQDQGNVFAGNETGILVYKTAANGNVIQGNDIGSSNNADQEVGIWIVDAPGTVVGGLESKAANKLAGNNKNVRIQGVLEPETLLQWNELGKELGEDEEDFVPDETDSTVPPADDDDSDSNGIETESANNLYREYFAEMMGAFVPASYTFPSPPLQGAILVVDSTGDGTDANPGDGFCNNGSGSCTLRAAIQEANALTGADEIRFNISGTGPHTIQPQSPLPTITGTVVIDGSTQSGYTATTPMVELDGSQAGAGADGLTIDAPGCLVNGLVINSFDGYGLDIQGGGDNTITANFVGTEPNGTTAAGNYKGVIVRDDGGTLVGGATAADRNLISGNENDGIVTTSQTDDTLIQGNYIGVRISGSLALANGGDGVDVEEASNTTIGGTATGEGNLISGNGGTGIEVDDSPAPANTVIQGNLIGTDASGGTAIPNYRGIDVGPSSNTTIGGTASGAGNVISGNTYDGILIYGGANTVVVQGNKIGTNSAGTLALANGGDGIDVNTAAYVTIGGTATGAGNLISGNGSDGIELGDTTATTNTLIQGNLIGTNASGTSALTNDGMGILIGNAIGTTIGGGDSGARNLISGNYDDGIFIHDGADNTVIKGNYIGSNLTGTQAIANDGGIDVRDVTNTTIGGTGAGEGNLVSGNTGDGIFIDDGADGTTVVGNLIGTNASGTSALPNTDEGIDIETASDTTIGGTASGAGNVISGNGDKGMEIDNPTPPTNTIIQGNYIGTNLAGTSAVPNTSRGIVLGTSSGTTIGGTGATAHNVISGNGNDGLYIFGSAATVVVYGNHIGTNAEGTSALPNDGEGVEVVSGSSITIGGEAAGEGNLISGNGDIGLQINSGTGILVSGNRIFNNDDIGIDLAGDGVTANDLGDSDSGPNNLQNFPVISSATSDGFSSTIQGTLNSSATTTFRLEFFANAACDASGNGEGEIYLGGEDVLTDGSGDAPFTIDLDVVIAEGYYVTGTAIAPDGSTSEFSACRLVEIVAPPVITATYVYDGDGVMVKSIVNGVTTYYVGGYYEVEENGSDTIERKYYSAAGMRIAMRTIVNDTTDTLNWLLGDHLASTSMVADASGAVVSEVRYSAFGEIRYQNGTLTTDYLYTGQRQEAEIGLYYFVARWYDPATGRFIQADSIVPNPASAKGFDRYSYSYNSPLNYLDPSGHRPILMDGDQFAETDKRQGITNVISTKARDLTNNANNYKPLSKKDKNVAFPDKNYNHKNDDVTTGAFEPMPGFSSDFINPFGGYSNDKQRVIDEALEYYYGGMDNLLSEARECFIAGTPSECNNPFWENNPHGHDVRNGDTEYPIILSTQLDSNSSNLFWYTLLVEAGSDVEVGSHEGNFDPWWLYALSTDVDLVRRAAEITTEIMIASPHGYDPEYIEFISNLSVTGN